MDRIRRMESGWELGMGWAGINKPIGPNSIDSLLDSLNRH